MFDKKSDFALNKREKDAIIYISTTGIVYLTRADFSSETEFLKWKNWSDGDYRACEQTGRGFYDNTIPIDESLDVIGAVLSVEDELFGGLNKSEYDRLCAALIVQVKSCLTNRQYRRLWLFHVEGLSMSTIAAAEGVTEQSISESILAAKKNIFVFLQKHPVEMPIFL